MEKGKWTKFRGCWNVLMCIEIPQTNNVTCLQMIFTHTGLTDQILIHINPNPLPHNITF